MANETKVGVAVFATLVCMFGFVLYRKYDDQLTALAALKSSGDEAGETSTENPLGDDADDDLGSVTAVADTGDLFGGDEGFGGEPDFAAADTAPAADFGADPLDPAANPAAPAEVAGDASSDGNPFGDAEFVTVESTPPAAAEEEFDWSGEGFGEPEPAAETVAVADDPFAAELEAFDAVPAESAPESAAVVVAESTPEPATLDPVAEETPTFDAEPVELVAAPAADNDALDGWPAEVMPVDAAPTEPEPVAVAFDEPADKPADEPAADAAVDFWGDATLDAEPAAVADAGASDADPFLMEEPAADLAADAPVMLEEPTELAVADEPPALDADPAANDDAVVMWDAAELSAEAPAAVEPAPSAGADAAVAWDVFDGAEEQPVALADDPPEPVLDAGGAAGWENEPATVPFPADEPPVTELAADEPPVIEFSVDEPAAVEPAPAMQEDPFGLAATGSPETNLPDTTAPAATELREWDILDPAEPATSEPAPALADAPATDEPNEAPAGSGVSPAGAFAPEADRRTPTRVNPGQVQTADGRTSTPFRFSGPNDRKVAEVQKGESYWTVSQRAYGAAKYFKALARYNALRIRDPRNLQPGMKVICPPPSVLLAYDTDLAAEEKALASRNANPSWSGFAVDNDGRPVYMVGPGDTLGDIAQKHLGRASLAEQIIALNRDKIRDPRRLKPGILLNLPPNAAGIRRASGTSMR